MSRWATFLLAALLVVMTTAAGGALGSPVSANSVLHHSAGREVERKGVAGEEPPVAPVEESVEEGEQLPSAEGHQLSPEGGEVDQVPPEGGEVDQVPPEGGEVDQVPPEGGEVDQVPPEGGEVDQVPPEGGKVDQVLPEGGEGDQVPPEAPEVPQVLPEAPELAQVPPAEAADPNAIDQAPASDHPATANDPPPPPPPPSGASGPADTEAANDNIAAEAGKPPSAAPGHPAEVVITAAEEGGGGGDEESAEGGADGVGAAPAAVVVPDEGERLDPDDFVSEITLKEDLDSDSASVASSAGGALVEDTQFERREGPDGELLVGEKSVFCAYSRDILACDFLWAQKTVYLSARPQARGALKKISIRNVHDLKIDRSICYDLLLQDVTRALVVGDLAPPSCASDAVLSLENVGLLDRLPGTMTILSASSSKVSEVLLTKVGESFALTNTKVERLRIEDAVESEAQLTLRDVSLERLERLHLAEKARLSLDHCTVREVLEGGIALAATGNVLSEVKFLSHLLPQAAGTPPSVLLKPGADLTLTDVSGSVRVAAEACPQAPPSAACPEMPLASVGDSPSAEEDVAGVGSIESPKCLTVPMTQYFGFLILLVLLVLSLLLNLTQVFFNQPKSILKRFVHVKRTPAHYDSLKTGQERRCCDGLEHKSFQEQWGGAGSSSPAGGSASPPGGGRGGVMSNQGLQVGITVNDVDEVVLTGLRRRTHANGFPDDCGSKTAEGALPLTASTEGHVEHLAFLYPNHQSDPSSHPFPNDQPGSQQEQKGTHEEHQWSSEGQYLQVPNTQVFSYNGIQEERKII